MQFCIQLVAMLFQTFLVFWPETDASTLVSISSQLFGTQPIKHTIKIFCT